ncbi:TMEM164 family acyltransferase, partial [Streptococcus pyogenes]
HYALFVNSLLYLLRFPRKDLLDKPKVIIGTLSFSSLLLLVNQITGGNYGFLRETPLIGGASAPFRFLAVSMVFIFLILTFDFFSGNMAKF